MAKTDFDEARVALQKAGAWTQAGRTEAEAVQLWVNIAEQWIALGIADQNQPRGSS